MLPSRQENSTCYYGKTSSCLPHLTKRLYTTEIRACNGMPYPLIYHWSMTEYSVIPNKRVQYNLSVIFSFQNMLWDLLNDSILLSSPCCSRHTLCTPLDSNCVDTHAHWMLAPETWWVARSLSAKAASESTKYKSFGLKNTKARYYVTTRP
jgi:hypothetical protein